MCLWSPFYPLHAVLVFFFFWGCPRPLVRLRTEDFFLYPPSTRSYPRPFSLMSLYLNLSDTVVKKWEEVSELDVSDETLKVA